MVVSGEIEALGPGATTFREGDRVFGFDRFGFGAYAEYKCMPEGGVLAPAPAGLSHEDAVAIPYGGLLPSGSSRERTSARGRRCWSTERQVRSGPPPCSSRSTSARRSQRSAAP